MRQSLAAVRAATRNPDLRRLQLGFVGSATGYWAASIAVTVFAYHAGGGTAGVGDPTRRTLRTSPSCGRREPASPLSCASRRCASSSR